MKKEFRNFKEARKFVRSLNLKSDKEWRQYAKSGNKPDDIPYAVAKIYKNKGWISLGDWLGTGTVSPHHKQYLKFKDVRKFVHSLKLKNKSEWLKFCKSGKKPENIPSYPDHVYKNKGWDGMGGWLGTGSVASYNRKFRTYEKSKIFVHSLNVLTQSQWIEYCKSGKKPDDIPSDPRQVYKNKDWIGYGDWLGTRTIAPQNRKFRMYEGAKKFVHSLKLKNRDKWRTFCKSGNKPDDIPSNPGLAYKNQGWGGYGDWLGTGSKKPGTIKWKEISKAKKFVHSLKLGSIKDWKAYCKSGKKPVDIPSWPNETYKKKGWLSWGDWLGTNTIASYKIKFLPFSKSRKIIHSYHLHSKTDWGEFAKSDNFPKGVSKNPPSTYKKDWKGWGDWLGTGSIRPGDMDYLEFNEAKKIIRELAVKHNIRTNKDWNVAVKKGLIPDNIPKAPWHVYSKKRKK